MLVTLQGYLAQIQGLLHSAKSFVEQNQFNFAVLAAVVLLVVLAGWINGIWKRLQFRRELRNTELVAYHLDRIAGALERLSRFQRTGLEVSRSVSPAQETAAANMEEAPRQAGVGSMFGFSSGMTLPNPMYRPR